MKHFKLFINNEWVDSSSKQTFFSYNPASGDIVAELSQGTKEDVDKACNAAQVAFESCVWSRLTPYKRLDYITRAADILKRRFEEFAIIESYDTGKPIRETRMVDIPISIKALEYHARIALSIKGDTIPLEDTNRFDYTTYEPLGVVGIISPWNYPLHLLTRAVAPALAAGNCVVAKASSLTPVTSQMMGEVFLEAGFPAGVVNIISGPGNEVGEAILANPYVKAVSFTGSEEVGRNLMKQSSEAPIIKKLILELGGKGAFIAHKDCNIDGAIKSIMKGFISNMGEVCCASTRLFVHEDIYDVFMNELVKRTEGLKIGNPMDEDTMIGAIISSKQVEVIDNYVKSGIAEGATLLYGGERMILPAPLEKGNFYKPTILTDVTMDMKCVKEEIFGPVLVVFKYSSIDDVIKKANATNFGLGASVWSENPRTLIKIAESLDAGTVWMNDSTSSQIEAPFGGNKNSGIGRENGLIGLLEYMKIKNHIWYVGDKYDDYFGA